MTIQKEAGAIFKVELSEEELWGVFDAAIDRGDAQRAGALWRALQAGSSGRLLEKGEEAILKACRSSAPGGADILKELISCGARLHHDSLASCCSGSVAERSEKMRLIGASGEAHFMRGRTPVVFLAAGIQDEGEGAAEAVRLLLGMGADPNATNDNGVSPFDLAMLRQNLATAEALLEGGATPGERWNAGSAMFDDAEFERAYRVMAEKVELGKTAKPAPTRGSRPGL